jgi:hypothetical protein
MLRIRNSRQLVTSNDEKPVYKLLFEWNELVRIVDGAFAFKHELHVGKVKLTERSAYIEL